MNKNLISILVPCYNAEKQIDRLIKSIIIQDYRPLELIIVNDGSTDNSEKEILKYKDIFEISNISFKYFYQKNHGQAHAMNFALKHFTGDFLCWVDADDYLEPTAMSDRIKVFEENPNCAIVSCDSYIREEYNLDKYILASSWFPKRFLPNQFDLLIEDRSAVFCGCHMIKSKAFFEVNPEKEIYVSSGGQNWQILLPIYYKFNRIYIDKPLYNYIIYSNSHSHCKKNYEQNIERINTLEDIMFNTFTMIEKVQECNLDNKRKKAKSIFLQKKIKLAIEFNQIIKLFQELKQKINHSGLEVEDIKLICSCFVNKFLTSISLFLRKG